MTDTPQISVAVLLSAGRHPVSGASRAAPGDAAALALARKLAGDGVLALHAGSHGEPALQDYLAFGAGRIEVLTVGPGQDILPPLAERLRNVDLILTGARAERGAGSGTLPYALAHALKYPIIPNVLEATREESELRVRQFLPKGRRRAVAAPPRAILVVHPLAPADLRYAHARRLTGRIETALAAPLAAESRSWTVETTERRPVRLKAEDKKAAHARLLSAIVSEAKGGTVAIEGSSVDKAQIVLSFLREHRLVDF
jgi:electron transfer flavoprotein beta subunit